MNVAAFVFISSEDDLLLVKQTSGHEYWSLPGGSVESNETIEQAAVREVREETGLEVLLSRVIGIYLKPSEDGLAITFEAEVVGGRLRPDHEISECAYFPVGSLPTHVRDHFSQRIEDRLRAESEIIFREQ